LSGVSNYFQWTHNRGVSGVGMFNALPLTFQAELSLMINKKVLEKVRDKLYAQLASSEFELAIETTSKPLYFSTP